MILNITFTVSMIKSNISRYLKIQENVTTYKRKDNKKQLLR